MGTLLWVIQVLGAVVYGASGTMKIFFFDRIRHEVPTFGALPRPVWGGLGVLELTCVVGLLLPGLVGWQPRLTGWAAATLAAESLVFIGVHVAYREVQGTVVSAILGLVMAALAYGRFVWAPLG